MINATEIVGVIYLETVKRQGSFGYTDRETDSKDKDFISEDLEFFINYTELGHTIEITDFNS